MKIAVMATGGVGGWFGAKLALAGEDVCFIARGAHLAAIRESGLRIKSPSGDMTVKPAQVTDDPATVGPVDIVLFAVKLWDTETAAEACRPLLGLDTGVISFQNGVDGETVIGETLGPQHAMGGVAGISAVIDAPGVIRQTGTMAWLRYGELDGRPSTRLAAFHQACVNAGIDGAISPKINVDIWKKFVFLVALSGATAVTRVSIGPILADPDMRAMFAALMKETAMVGRKARVNLPDDLIADRIVFAEGLPGVMKASMLADLESGNRLELPWLSGRVVQLGRELGVPTPVNATVYAALKPYAPGRH